ncbi:MAG: Gldg family protein [Clostridia bacterium]|nr:Gldg family protein [Clostridia bacterium]
MNKKRKYAYAAMTFACLVIAVVVVLNIVVIALSDRMNLNIDMTPSKILDFDKKTHEIVDGLDMDVNIYSLVPQDSETDELKQIDEILKKYDTMSEFVHYKRIDTKKNPGYLANYSYDGVTLNKTEQPNYHIVFETERDYEVVDVNSLLPVEEDEKLPKMLWAEQYFTSAILKVVKGSDINIYVVSGHNEIPAQEIKKVVPGSGYNFTDLALATGDIPEDADMIAIVSPKTDYTESEIEKISLFLDKGGDVHAFIDPYFGSEEAMQPYANQFPNLSTLFGEWGITVKDGYVYDGNEDNFSETRSNIIATIPENTVTDEIFRSPTVNKSSVYISLARPVAAKNKNDIYAYTVAQTSEDGYIKYTSRPASDVYDSTADERIQSELAVLTARTNPANNTSSRFFVAGASNIIISNPELYGELINFTTDSGNTVFIMPKDIERANVVIKQSTVYMYAFVVVALIPVIILAFGFIIWIRRRHL